MGGEAWFLNSVNDSLGFLLADQGFDVWVRNIRGIEWSHGHVTLSKSDKGFWDWSRQELANIDLPTMHNYVNHITNSKVKMSSVLENFAPLPTNNNNNNNKDEEEMIQRSDLIDTPDPTPTNKDEEEMIHGLTSSLHQGGICSLGAVVSNYKGDHRKRDMYLKLFLELRPLIMWNPCLVSEEVGIGVNARNMKRYFLSSFTTVYSMRPLPYGSVFRCFPGFMRFISK